MEIQNVRKYADYVLLISLACPPLLYDDFCYDLFKQVASGVQFVHVYRGVVRFIICTFSIIRFDYYYYYYYLVFLILLLMLIMLIIIFALTRL